ncbi:DUF1697 domain-containing protein [Cellulomonas hominis]
MERATTPAPEPAAPHGEPVVLLLRGINVGGARKVAMADLRAIAERLGHMQVATHLNSGNLVLVPSGESTGTRPDDGPAHERLVRPVEQALLELTGVDIDVVARTATELEAVVAGNPYPADAEDDPAHLLVMFFATPVERPGAIDPTRIGREEITWAGAHAYLRYPDGIGRSKLTPDVLTRAARQPGTARNWTTLLAVRARLADRRG